MTIDQAVQTGRLVVQALNRARIPADLANLTDLVSPTDRQGPIGLKDLTSHLDQTSQTDLADQDGLITGLNAPTVLAELISPTRLIRPTEQVGRKDLSDQAGQIEPASLTELADQIEPADRIEQASLQGLATDLGARKGLVDLNGLIVLTHLAEQPDLSVLLVPGNRMTGLAKAPAGRKNATDLSARTGRSARLLQKTFNNMMSTSVRRQKMSAWL